MAPGGGGGAGGYAAPTLGPAAVSHPESLDNHNVQEVIGNDPASGNVFFWGTAGPPQLDEEGAPVEDSKQIPQGSIDAIGQQQADEANRLVTEFLTDGDARIAAMQAERTVAIEAVRGAIAAEKAKVMGAVAVARQAVQGKAAAARAAVSGNAAQARGAVNTGLQDTIGLIDGALQTSRGTVEARSQGATGDVATMRTTFTAGVNQAFTSGIAAVQAVGTDFAGRANQQAAQRAAQYQAQALPHTSGWDDFWDGENFERNKRTARVNAATQVGTAYAEEFTKKAGEVATGLQGGARQVIDGAGQTFTQAESSITQATTAALGQLEQAAGQAKQAAQEFATQRLATIDTEEQQLLQLVGSSEQQALGQLDAAGRSGCSGIDQIGDASIQQIETGYGTAVQAMTSIVDEVRAGMCGAEPPPAETIMAALEQKKADLDATENTAKQMLTAQVETAKQQITTTGQQQVSGVQQAQAATTSALDQIIQSSNQSLQANMQAVAQVRQHAVGGFQQAAGQIVEQHETSVSGAVTGLRGDTDAALSNVNSRLGQYSTDLSGDFTNTLAGMNAKITSEASAAAAKVQPAWRSFVSILIKIIVAIVVAVAIAALFASGVGVLALIVGGFLIGAAGAALTYLTDCALGLQEFSVGGLLTEMAVGGIGGVIGALTCGMGSAAANALTVGLAEGFKRTVISVAVSTGVNFVINSGSTFVQQMVKNVGGGKPLFEGTWTAVKENAGINLIGAFAGSLGPSRVSTGRFGMPTGSVPIGEALRAVPGNMGQALGDVTRAGVAVVGGGTAVAGGAMGGAAAPSNNNAVPHDQSAASQELRGQVGAGVRTEIDTAAAAHDTPAPSAPWTFDPTRG